MFETTPDIMIVVLMKIIVDNYTTHMDGVPLRLQCPAAALQHSPWFRDDSMPVEFDLVYR